MNSTDNDKQSATRTARSEAAALFAAAARNEAAGPAAQLHCLTAATTLGGSSGPVPATTDSTAPDRLMEQALQILGNLPAEDFAQPDVLTAARCGRRALREPN